MSNEFLGFKVIVDDSQPPNVISITGASAAKVGATLKRLETELTKLRAALKVADKALEHYGDTSNWLDSNYNGEVDRPILYWNGESRCPCDDVNGFDVAQQARTEIASVLEGK